MYAKLPQVGALAEMMRDRSVTTVSLEGLVGSAAPMVFSSLAAKCGMTVLFILKDADEAGYFYHDLTQVMGQESVLFFPSSYRRAVKYGQRDAASEILRTEVMARIGREEGRGKNEEVAAAVAFKDESPVVTAAATSSFFTHPSSLYIVSYPEAVAELVVSRRLMDSRTLELAVGQTVDVAGIMRTLRDFGFREVEYVYEPGQFALRGSILDVYSYSSEYPFRIDFFGDDIDSIRTFEVDTQLSRERRTEIKIVPELAGMTEERVPLFSFFSDDTVVVMKDGADIRDAVGRIYQDGFSQQAIAERMEGATEMEQHAIMQQMRKEVQLVSGPQFAEAIAPFRIMEIGHRPFRQPEAILHFNISSQPLFHKNFDMLRRSLEDYRLRGYSVFILADSRKQNERLKEILGSEEGRVDKGGNYVAGGQRGE